MARLSHSSVLIGPVLSKWSRANSLNDGIRIASEREFEKRNRRRNLPRGCSSVGRAVALQAIGQEFESPQLHQTEISNL